MGVDIRIESENGDLEEELLDEGNLTTSLLPDRHDASSLCLRWIDPYGDTVFNQQQIPYLIRELEGIVAAVSDAQTSQHGKALLRLVCKAQKKVHTYVRFVGD